MNKFKIWYEKYKASNSPYKKILGVILILIGLLALVTPFTPGSWLAFFGLELLGFRLAIWNKFKEKIFNEPENNFMKKVIIGFIVLALFILALILEIKLKKSDPKTIPTNTKTEIPLNPDIRLTSPLPNQEITSPITITGQARGGWFFESTFPIMLTDWNGKIVAQGIAEAQGDWMTENFVPFKATINFTKPEYKNNGILILKKDNPSGLPEFDQSIEIPITFK